MQSQIRKSKLRIAAFLAVILIAVTIMAQETEQQKRVAAFKQAVQQSMAGLRKYEWIETTTVMLKGEVKSQKRNRCYYGTDGQIQKVPIDDAAAPPQEQPAGRRGGRLKGRIIAKKKEEMTDYMKQAAIRTSICPPIQH